MNLFMKHFELRLPKTEGFAPQYDDQSVLLYDGWKSILSNNPAAVENDVTTELEYKQYCFDRFRESINNLKMMYGRAYATFIDKFLDDIDVSSLIMVMTDHPINNEDPQHMDNSKRYVLLNEQSYIDSSIAATKFVRSVYSLWNTQKLYAGANQILDNTVQVNPDQPAQD